MLSSKSDIGHDHSWAEIQDKPDLYTKLETDDSFATINHTHSWQQIQDTPNFYTEEQVSEAISVAVSHFNEKIAGYEFVIKLGTGTTLADRLANPNTVLPSGWNAFDASNINADGNFAGSVNHFVVQYTGYENTFVCDAMVTEHRASGPAAAQGIIRVDYSSVTIPWKSNVSLTQIGFMNLQNVVSPTCDVYLYIKLVNIPS